MLIIQALLSMPMRCFQKICLGMLLNQEQPDHQVSVDITVVPLGPPSFSFHSFWYKLISLPHQGSSRRSAERDRSGVAGSSVTVATSDGGAPSSVPTAGSASGSVALNVASGSGAIERDRASSTAGIGVGGPASSSDRDTIFRWRDRQYHSGPKRWLESALRDPAWQEKDEDGSGGGKKRENNACLSPL